MNHSEKTRVVQVVLFDGFDPMDVLGPYEVLWAASHATRGALRVELAALDGPRDVTSGTGLALRATAPLLVDGADGADVIVVPGAVGPLDGSEASIPALIARAASSPLTEALRVFWQRRDGVLATVCGGSLVLAMAGIIEGRTAVTHHMGLDVLASCGVHVVRARVVDDGRLVSAGGVTSGIDLALYLLERELGPRVAIEVERMFDFERRGTPWKNTGIAASFA